MAASLTKKPDSTGPEHQQIISVTLTSANPTSEPFDAWWASRIWANQKSIAGTNPFTTLKFLFVDSNGNTTDIPAEVAICKHPTIGASPAPGYITRPPTKVAIQASGGSGADRSLTVEIQLAR